MKSKKIAITINGNLLRVVDDLVENDVFPNRSQAIQLAVQEKIDRLEHNRLAKECAKLDPSAEQAMADEGLSGELDQWPAY